MVHTVRMTRSEVLIVAIRQLRDGMRASPKKQRWTWDDIEAYLSGALSVYGMDVDEILDILRGKD